MGPGIFNGNMVIGTSKSSAVLFAWDTCSGRVASINVVKPKRPKTSLLWIQLIIHIVTRSFFDNRRDAWTRSCVGK